MVLIYIHPKHVSLRNKLLNCYLNNRGLGFTPSASSACDSLTIFFTLRVGGLLGSRRRMDGKAFARWGCWSDTLTNAHTPQQRPLFADLPAAPRKMNGWLWKHNDYITLKVSLSRRAKLGHVFGWLLLSPNADPYQLRFNNSKIQFWFIPGIRSQDLILCACQCHQENKCGGGGECPEAYRTIPSPCVFRPGIVR